MKITIDLRSDIPIYLQIAEQIRQQVVNGSLKPNDQLPTVRGLASELRINFNTVSRAYHLLDEAGLISTQQGRGTYILEMLPPEMAERLRQDSLGAITRHFLSQAKRLGFTLDQSIASIHAQSNNGNIEL